ncbi:MAG: histidine kinase dimerization/phospho-acceptor domain-containing protein [Patescibacteria group bacterium]|jgi:signal transduction histidine kinase
MLVSTKNRLILTNKSGRILTYNSIASDTLPNIKDAKSIFDLFPQSQENYQEILTLLEDVEKYRFVVKSDHQIFAINVEERFRDNSLLIKILVYPSVEPLPQESFIQFVSHELKSPLTTIKLFAEILFSKLAKTNLDKKNLSHLSKIDAKIESLVSEINDFADLVRLNDNILRLNFTRLPLSPLLIKLKKKLPNVTIEIPQGKSPYIFVDETRFIQSLTNYCIFLTEKSNTNNLIITAFYKPHAIELMIYPSGLSQKKHQSPITLPRPGVSLLLSEEILQMFAGNILLFENSDNSLSALLTLPTDN